MLTHSLMKLCDILLSDLINIWEFSVRLFYFIPFKVVVYFIIILFILSIYIIILSFIYFFIFGNCAPDYLLSSPIRHHLGMCNPSLRVKTGFSLHAIEKYPIPSLWETLLLHFVLGCYPLPPLISVQSVWQHLTEAILHSSSCCFYQQLRNCLSVNYPTTRDDLQKQSYKYL